MNSNTSMNNKTESPDKNLDSTFAESAALEKISGLTYDGGELSLVVNSNGCTKAQDFLIEHVLIEQELSNDICLVTVRRTKPDHCRKAPHAVRINIDWQKPESCEHASLVFANPLLEFQSSAATR